MAGRAGYGPIRIRAEFRVVAATGAKFASTNLAHFPQGSASVLPGGDWAVFAMPLHKRAPLPVGLCIAPCGFSWGRRVGVFSYWELHPRDQRDPIKSVCLRHHGFEIIIGYKDNRRSWARIDRIHKATSVEETCRYTQLL